ncbi:MAG: hypothetical protein KIS66_04600 [Fimbriimonadaceae bacterium]|nr:hypothetical protein [Fimbriimonadaceae bacterium]
MLVTACLLSVIAITAIQPDHVATRPVPRNDEAWWVERHARCVATTKANDFDVAFLGDSITQGWEGGGKPTWDATFAPLKSANFGFSGDRTEHVLWRLANGELLGTKAKLVVIMIGTNNIGHGSSTPDQAVDGIRAILAALHRGLPRAKVLLLGVFPRGEMPDDPMRVKAAAITAQLPALADGKRVFYQDLGPHFTRIDGTLRTLLMPDMLHLNTDGYMIWGRAIEPTVRELLKR